MIIRVNSINDVNYGAGQGIKIEEHLYQTEDGRLKRFFDENDIKEFLKDFKIVYLKEETITRYKLEKILYRVCVQKNLLMLVFRWRYKMKEYTYNIIDDVYNWMVSKSKDIEVRILKEKSQLIQIGDIVTFNNQDKAGKFVKVKIVNKQIVNNIQELLEKFSVKRMMPGHTEEEFVLLMRKIYGEELIKKQIVAFEFEYISCDCDVNIIEYEEKYLDDVRDLLVELEEYIVSIDKDNLDILHPEYRDKMAILDLEKINNYDGKCYLAIESGKVIGLIMGCVPLYDKNDYLDYKCPKRGEITELIVTKKTRSKGVGQMLINKLEEYFKSIGCEYIIVDVFAYNEIGQKFYFKNKYHTRLETMIKKIS